MSIPFQLPKPESSESRYLLLDGAQCPRSPRTLRIPSAVEWGFLFDGALDGNRDVAPCLVRLRDAHDTGRTRQALHAAGISDDATLWLDSPLMHGDLLDRLSNRLTIALPNGKRIFLRFYDARVLPHLSAVLEAGQSASFFAVARRWWYRSPQLQWCHIAATAATMDPLDAPMTLSLSQRRALQDRCYPYAVIAHFTDTSPELLEPIAIPDRYQFFHDTIQAAAGFNVTDSADLILFSTVALLEGADFHRTSIWQTLLQEVSDGRRNISEIFDEHYQEAAADVD